MRNLKSCGVVIFQVMNHEVKDLALASILAFWCGRDIEQMDRLFRKSGLMRKKWFVYKGQAWESDTGNLKVMQL